MSLPTSEQLDRLAELAIRLVETLGSRSPMGWDDDDVRVYQSDTLSVYYDPTFRAADVYVCRLRVWNISGLVFDRVGRMTRYHNIDVDTTCAAIERLLVLDDIAGV